MSKLQSLFVNTVNEEWCQWGRWLQPSYFYILKTFKRLILYLLRSQVHHAQDPLQFAYQANEDGGRPSPIGTEHTHTWSGKQSYEKHVLWFFQRLQYHSPLTLSPTARSVKLTDDRYEGGSTWWWDGLQTASWDLRPVHLTLWSVVLERHGGLCLPLSCLPCPPLTFRITLTTDTCRST